MAAGYLDRGAIVRVGRAWAHFCSNACIRLVAVLFGVSLLTFSVLHLIPGDPVRVMLGDSIGGAASGDQSQSAYDNLRHQLGLDRPLPVQYARYLGHALTGDLGRSFQTRRTILSSIHDALPATLALAFSGMAIAILLGTTLGIIAALKHHTWWDTGIMVLSLLGLAMPSFWLGLVLMLIFSFRLALVPGDHRGPAWPQSSSPR